MPRSDTGHDLTEVELGKLQKRIENEFSKCAAELQMVAEAYFEKFKVRDAKMLAKLKEGKITQDEYNSWRLAQLGRGARFEALRDKLAERITDTNAQAIDYVRDAMPSMYAINRNYAAYTIEQVSKNVDFTLWDEATVRRLLVEQPDLMPYYSEVKALNRGIDLAYGKDQITKAVTSGILQGTSIDKMAADIMNRVVGIEKSSAIRAARTAATGAENAGRMDTYDQATSIGIKMEKEWMATLDSRTRDSHAKLDGQHVATNKKFGNGLMYPGDRSGAASEVYNCRCTMVAWFPEIEEENNKRLTYSQWKGMKQSASNTESSNSYLLTGKIAGLPSGGKSPEEYDSAISKAKNKIESLEKKQKEILKEWNAARREKESEVSKFLQEKYSSINRKINDLNKYSADMMYKREQFGRGKNTSYFTKIFGSIKGEHSILDDVFLSNPLKGTENCGFTTLAFDARRRGINAKAGIIDGLSIVDFKNQWEGLVLNHPNSIVDPVKQIEDSAMLWGRGSRGVVYIKWADYNGGHYFNFEVDKDGKVIFCDGQNGLSGKAVRDYFTRCDKSSILFGRTDNLKLSEYAVKSLTGDE